MDCWQFKKTVSLLARSTTFIASLDATNRQPEPQNGFPSKCSVLSTAVLGHSHYLHMTHPSKSWPESLPHVRLDRPLCFHLCYFRSSFSDVLKPLSTYRQIPFCLAIIPSFGSQRSQRERTSISRDDVAHLIKRSARTSYPTHPSSDDVEKPLSTYGQLPFR
ncbi:hypothetical protein DPMN_155071 [Dreissena polymorpha]|uniref:Uncharacterized protein n=1 Tax=Dreissena polymorpha TaxID=45954 RepID=A0A9D4FNU3_DREPO|nr:hypothetical protein DPMN_155071 [Dreissena polymorpha]